MSVAEQMGNPIGTTPSTISNANNISKNGIYRLYSSSIEESNSVPEKGWSFALIYLKANWITAQLAIGQSNLYYRAKLDETASWISVAWKKVTID